MPLPGRSTLILLRSGRERLLYAFTLMTAPMPESSVNSTRLTHICPLYTSIPVSFRSLSRYRSGWSLRLHRDSFRFRKSPSAYLSSPFLNTRSMTLNIIQPATVRAANTAIRHISISSPFIIFFPPFFGFAAFSLAASVTHHLVFQQASEWLDFEVSASFTIHIHSRYSSL